MDLEIITSSFPLLLAGAGVTIEITALSVGFGMAIGIVISLIRMTGIRLLRILGNVYVDFLRGTPLLVQIFLVYFALPALIHHQVDAFLLRSLRAPSTVGRMLRKFSAEALNPLTEGRWKRAAVWA
ncbi:ABC transporter permease subunit [Acidaminococcus intestini]|nr:ABC transporter permease subunit [Acidaminococcus intestini]